MTELETLIEQVAELITKIDFIGKLSIFNFILVGSLFVIVVFMEWNRNE